MNAPLGFGPVLGRDVVRELDRRAIEEYGMPSFALMENAGRACVDEIGAWLSSERATAPVAVVCGPGNNGGDGLVIARTLVNRGIEAEVLFVGDAGLLTSASPDVTRNVALWRGLGRDVTFLPDVDAVLSAVPRLGHSGCIVDALFGTGLTRELAGPWAEAVRRMDEAAAPVLAVDLPSGLDADTGEVLGAACRADATVTFVARKPGFLRRRGPELSGPVIVAEIGIPRPLLEEAARQASTD